MTDLNVSASLRLAWIKRLDETGSAKLVCAEFGISRPTLRKWLQRYRDQGEAGLEEPSRRPASSPNRKIFAAEEALILDLRRQKGLGLHRLRSELKRAHGLEISADTILKVLRRANEPVLRPGKRTADPVERASSSERQSAVLPDIASDDAVTAAITDLITTGQLRPGEKLSEATLGTRLGVGRTKIREALKQLAVGGLVTLLRNRGAFVATPSIQEVEQAYAARRLVEGEIIADVTRHSTAHDMRVLKAHLEQQVAAEAAGNRGKLVRLLTEFHLVIASLGENRILEGFLASLAAKTSLAVLLYDHGGDPSCAVEEHAQLIDLIAAGDAERAVALMRRHLTTNQGRLHPETA